MTLVFRNDIGPYTGKGSPLTSLEVDGNFYDLDTRVIALEDNPFGLASISFTGGSITFNWSDSTSSGPFALPIAMPEAKGEWQNDTTYNRLDIVSVDGVGYFLVLQDHHTAVAPATFDPAEETTDGLIYQQIGGGDFTAVMRYKGEWDNGTEYSAYDVVTNATYGLFVVLVQHISAATFDPNALDDDDSPLYERIAGPVFSPVEEMTATSYTLTLLDAGKFYRCPNGCDVTFPSGVDFPVGTEIHFRQTGADPVYFLESDTDIALNPQREGYETATPWKGATVTAKCVAAGEWDLIGPFGDLLTE